MGSIGTIIIVVIIVGGLLALAFGAGDRKPKSGVDRDADGETDGRLD